MRSLGLRRLQGVGQGAEGIHPTRRDQQHVVLLIQKPPKRVLPPLQLIMKKTIGKLTSSARERSGAIKAIAKHYFTQLMVVRLNKEAKGFCQGREGSPS